LIDRAANGFQCKYGASVAFVQMCRFCGLA
jgi:hypothetical protein